MSKGGFDVVLGNPPYVEDRVVRGQYALLPQVYATETAGNLYAYCMERSGQLLGEAGWFGMIVPSAMMGLDEVRPLRTYLAGRYTASVCSTYAIRPSKLFEGVDQRLCIFIGSTAGAGLWTSRYHHWFAPERTTLFQRLTFERAENHPRLDRFPQVGSPQAHGVLTALERSAAVTVGHLLRRSRTPHVITYHRSPRYWIRAMDSSRTSRARPEADRFITTATCSSTTRRQRNGSVRC